MELPLLPLLCCLFSRNKLDNLPAYLNCRQALLGSYGSPFIYSQACCEASPCLEISILAQYVIIQWGSCYNDFSVKPALY